MALLLGSTCGCGIFETLEISDIGISLPGWILYMRLKNFRVDISLDDPQKVAKMDLSGNVRHSLHGQIFDVEHFCDGLYQYAGIQWLMQQPAAGLPGGL